MPVHEPDYKKVAVERFVDATVLYQNGRYAASLYLSGYVIEIGAKAEFQRLGNIKLSQLAQQSGQIIENMFQRIYQRQSPDNERWIKGFHFPESLFDFINFADNLASLKETRNKELHNQVKESDSIMAIL